MQYEVWGLNGPPHLALPDRPTGFVLLGLLAAVLVLGLWRQRADFAALSRRRFLLFLFLIGASVAANLFLPIYLASERQLPPLSTAQNPVAILLPFTFVPLLLAAATVGTLPAMIVGLAGGAARALWLSNQVYDPIAFALAAMLAAWLVQQNFSGQLYRWLRSPAVAGLFVGLLNLAFIGVATFAYADSHAGNLAALDVALSTSATYLLPMIVIGLADGLLASLLVWGLPQLRKHNPPALSPLARNLNTRLLLTFGLFMSLLSFALVVAGFYLALRVATRIAVQQMAQDAQGVSATIPDFRAHRQNLLIQASLESALLEDDPAVTEAALRRLYRSGDFYRRLMLVGESQEIRASFPADPEANALTNFESTAVDRTLDTRAPFVSPAQAYQEDGYVISFVVPVVNGAGQPAAALVGRVPDLSLEILLVGLQGTLGAGEGFLVDEQGVVIAHPHEADLLKSWSPSSQSKPVQVDLQGAPGVAYEGFQGSTNERQLVYYQAGPDHPWTVVITLPYEVVLGQALQIAAQLAGVMAVTIVLSGAYLLLLGRSITQPLTELAGAAQRIARGSLNTPVHAQGNDQIGRLGQAFGQMQTSLKRRLDDLSLLLSVSQDVSKTMDIGRGMPAILRGAVRSSGAMGVRVVVQNPNSRLPLSFGEGPACEAMAPFDRLLMNLMRDRAELELPADGQEAEKLHVQPQSEHLPLPLFAIQLASNDRFQGVLWVTYRPNHHFEETELNVLRTLAHHASVLVENARLYANAEGGRRQLAAVLASTDDPVIVTDQTGRILLVNPAMERVLDHSYQEVRLQLAKKVVKDDRLLKAITSTSQKAQTVEIEVTDGRTLYASSSPVTNSKGQAMGRVTVLHDVTAYKEVDHMKSEFVATVSHDLRTPLTFMRSYATMMPMVATLDVRQEEYLHKIISGIDQMSGLIDDLLDLGRLEAGIDLLCSDVRVDEVLYAVAEEFDQPARESGINLVVRAAERLPTVHVDVSLLRQAVANLVSNTIKYAPGSGEVVIGVYRQRGEIVILVKDHGPGIARADQMRLFEKFYRIKQRGTRDVKGSGLGLALVKSIAERHGGKAWCESEPQVGSTFYLSLPVLTAADSPDPTAGKKPAAPPQDPPAAGNGSPLVGRRRVG